MVEHSLSGNLMGIMGMTEMLDVEYFRDDMKTALMFGTLAEGNHRLANIKIVGRKFSINISDQETSVMIDDEEFLKGNGGKFVIRQFIENERGGIYYLQQTGHNLEYHSPVLIKSDKSANYVFNVERGKHKIVIDKYNKVYPEKLQFNV